MREPSPAGSSPKAAPRPAIPTLGCRGRCVPGTLALEPAPDPVSLSRAGNSTCERHWDPAGDLEAHDTTWAASPLVSDPEGHSPPKTGGLRGDPEAATADSPLPGTRGLPAGNEGHVLWSRERLGRARTLVASEMPSPPPAEPRSQEGDTARGMGGKGAARPCFLWVPRGDPGRPDLHSCPLASSSSPSFWEEEHREAHLRGGRRAFLIQSRREFTSPGS